MEKTKKTLCVPQENRRSVGTFLFVFIFLLIKYLAFSDILKTSFPWFGMDTLFESPKSIMFLVLAVCLVFLYTILLHRLQKSVQDAVLLLAVFVANPFIPLCFRNGQFCYSRTVGGTVEVTEDNLFGSIDKWKI